MTATNSIRRLVELSPDGILISQNDRLVFANPAADACAAWPIRPSSTGTPLARHLQRCATASSARWRATP